MKTPLLALLFAALCAGQPVLTQSSQQQAPAPPAPTAPAKPQPSEGPAARPSEKNHLITREEARELFRSVDEILQFASKDTGFPIKHAVKKEMLSRTEVEKYVGEKFKNDEDRKRFERSELVLKKFGL